MAEDKKKEQPIKKRKKRAKAEKQKELEIIREILNKGLDIHKMTIDKVIHDYTEYKQYDELVKKRNEYDERVKAVEQMKQQQAD